MHDEQAVATSSGTNRHRGKTMLRRFASSTMICLMLGVGCAQAAPQWQRLWQDEQSTYYLDTQSTSSKGSVKTFWSLRDYPQTQSNFDGKAFKSTLAQIQLDCSAQEALVLEITYFSDNMLGGDKVLKERDFHNAQPVDSRSPIHRYAVRLCK
jgi:hypothetical protein